ncbi:ferredoxin--NADP reductase [Nocardioides cavernaquae]|uniref:FAD-dependent oxidoreductase n=1 Tax=Nocardioides cavernaquae TaxID=2321396 RepID=A0A3A5HB55_9ACTN|nr:FAD-dependent oxidoreductase [Nocardioides cavernaquae]RJS47542.1 FAD-dependent oxidoreductase [Nocardioides cavernaquae]
MPHQNVDIPLTVIARRPETPDHLTLVFQRPPRFEFEAGDWIDLEIPGQELAGGRTYSLSSSPGEPDLAITFKVGQSGFKRALQDLSPGDQLRMTAYGNDYDFSLRQHRSSVLIAAGVGVAPFRSMIAEMAETASGESAHLIYLNRTDEFLFKSELDGWSEQLSGVRINYVVTAGMKSKERRRILADSVDDAVHYYYIAGPPAMIEATEAVLMDAGADHHDIRIDSFDGY